MLDLRLVYVICLLMFCLCLFISLFCLFAYVFESFVCFGCGGVFGVC